MCGQEEAQPSMLRVDLNPVAVLLSEKDLKIEIQFSPFRVGKFRTFGQFFPGQPLIIFWGG